MCKGTKSFYEILTEYLFQFEPKLLEKKNEGHDLSDLSGRCGHNPDDYDDEY